MDVMKVCQLCGAEIELRPQAGGMFYSAFDSETGGRHVCPVVQQERDYVTRLILHQDDEKPGGAGGDSATEKLTGAPVAATTARTTRGEAQAKSSHGTQGAQAMRKGTDRDARISNSPAGAGEGRG